jgi:hypothetical protein
MLFAGRSPCESRVAVQVHRIWLPLPLSQIFDGSMSGVGVWTVVRAKDDWLIADAERQTFAQEGTQEESAGECLYDVDGDIRRRRSRTRDDRTMDRWARTVEAHHLLRQDPEELPGLDERRCAVCEADGEVVAETSVILSTDAIRRKSNTDISTLAVTPACLGLESKEAVEG